MSAAAPTVDRRRDLARRVAFDAAQTLERLRTFSLGRTLLCLLLGALLVAAGLEGDRRWPEAGVVGLVALLSLGFAALWRYAFRRDPLAPSELGAALLLDVAAIYALLAMLGVGQLHLLLLSLPVAIAGLTLRWRRTAVVLAAAIVAAALLQAAHAPAGGDARLAVAGWEHGAVAAALAALFGLRLAEVVRLHRRRLAAAPPVHDPRTEALLSLATLAAGTAHEMGTPLSTLSTLIAELRREQTPPADWQRSLEVLWQATQACRRSLHDMAAAVEHGLSEDEVRSVDEFAREVAERHARQRADGGAVGVRVLLEGVGTAPRMPAGATVRQAMLNLLDNAAEVSPEAVELAVTWDHARVRLEVRDRGPGIPAELRARLGHSVVTTKAEGRGNGIGVFLAAAAVSRAGGRLAFESRAGGGTCARVELPVLDDAGSAAGATTTAAPLAHDRVRRLGAARAPGDTKPPARMARWHGLRGRGNERRTARPTADNQ